MTDTELPTPAAVIADGLLYRGDRVVLTGPAGCGKTTLLHMIAAKLAAGRHPFRARGLPVHCAVQVLTDPSLATLSAMNDARTPSWQHVAPIVCVDLTTMEGPSDLLQYELDRVAFAGGAVIAAGPCRPLDPYPNGPAAWRYWPDLGWYLERCAGEPGSHTIALRVVRQPRHTTTRPRTTWPATIRLEPRP